MSVLSRGRMTGVHQVLSAQKVSFRNCYGRLAPQAAINFWPTDANTSMAGCSSRPSSVSSYSAEGGERLSVGLATSPRDSSSRRRALSTRADDPINNAAHRQSRTTNATLRTPTSSARSRRGRNRGVPLRHKAPQVMSEFVVLHSPGSLQIDCSLPEGKGIPTSLNATQHHLKETWDLRFLHGLTPPVRRPKHYERH
jgi:hypothetical protein